MLKSKQFLLKVLIINVKHNLLPLCLLSMIIVILIPILFGTKNLDSKLVTAPLEMLLSTIGIVILTPIFLPEQRKDIEDVIRSKYIDVFYIYLIRIVCSVFSIIVFVLAASLFLYLNNCQINTKIIFGVIADCIFLGSIGLFIFALTNNFVTSLMFTSIYYFINLILQKKIKMFNLFSMMENDYSPNIYLFITGILLIIFSIIIKRWLLNNR